MSLFTSLCNRRLLAAFGLSCLCTTVTLAEPAGSPGMGGSVAVYQFDGIYKGSSRQVSTADASCRQGGEVAVEVNEGKLRLPWTERQVFEAPVARNGSFYATTASAGQADKHMTIVPTLQGRIASGTLSADYGTRWCRYRLEASQLPEQQHLTERTSSVRVAH